MKIWLRTFIILCLFLLCVPLTAQEEEDIAFAFGEVRSVTQDRIIINEYFEDLDDYENATYIFSPDVKFQNVSSYKDIPVGADVQIDYVSEDGKKIALVVVAEKEEEAPAVEEEGYIFKEE